MWIRYCVRRRSVLKLCMVMLAVYSLVSFSDDHLDGYVTRLKKVIPYMMKRNATSHSLNSSDDVEKSSNQERFNTDVQSGTLPSNQSNLSVNNPIKQDRGEIISTASIVIIVAYMRTGSTLIGKLFQQFPGTFYVFEPLRAVLKILPTNNQTTGTLKYINGENKTFHYNDRDDVISNELKNWFSCELDALSKASLTDIFHRIFTTDMKKFLLCLKKTHKGYSNMQMCIQNAMEKCKKAPKIVLKFIRLRMRKVLSLLPFFPNMKVIHLSRDARGVYNSRQRLEHLKESALVKQSAEHCFKWTDDLVMTKHIMQKYPGRLKIVQYEDLAERPLQTAKEIVEFTGLSFSNEIANYIRNQTSSSKDSCVFCTTRKNSTKTASKWRTQLKFESAKMIYNKCNNANEVFGYLPFHKQPDFKNLAIPSRVKLNVSRQLLDSGNF